jgi:low affinity Fe/Cu permease
MPDPIAVPRHHSSFDRFAKTAAKVTGRPITFVVAVGVIVAWVVTGPIFQFSDTWQLVINTGTTIVTFLMVFLIQNTQNRDSSAVQLKLDELIRTANGAHNVMLDLEELSEWELEAIRDRYEALAAAAREKLRQGMRDDDVPDLPDLDAHPKG